MFIKKKIGKGIVFLICFPLIPPPPPEKCGEFKLFRILNLVLRLFFSFLIFFLHENAYA